MEYVNSREIISNIQQPTAMKPWHRGYIGDIQAKTRKDVHNFVVAGIIEQVDDSTILIRELPVGKWTNNSWKLWLLGHQQLLQIRMPKVQ